MCLSIFEKIKRTRVMNNQIIRIVFHPCDLLISICANFAVIFHKPAFILGALSPTQKYNISLLYFSFFSLDLCTQLVTVSPFSSVSIKSTKNRSGCETMKFRLIRCVFALAFLQNIFHFEIFRNSSEINSHETKYGPYATVPNFC